MDRPMQFAPFDSCMSCFKGDTETMFAAEGEAEWIIVALHRATGMSVDESSATVAHFAQHELGCDPGTVPTGEISMAFRLCSDCAQRTGTSIGRLPDIPVYVQPEEA